MKILVVEDNELNRDMLGRRLKRQGFDVVFAVDGRAGVDAAKAERPDVILMDINLPVMSGWEATLPSLGTAGDSMYCQSSARARSTAAPRTVEVSASAASASER